MTSRLCICGFVLLVCILAGERLNAGDPPLPTPVLEVPWYSQDSGAPSIGNSESISLFASLGQTDAEKAHSAGSYAEGGFLSLFASGTLESAQPRVGFENATIELFEGSGKSSIPVRLDFASNSEVRVDFEITPGVGRSFAGIFAPKVNGTLTYPPGETLAHIDVTPLRDCLDSAADIDSVMLTLKNPINAQLGMAFSEIISRNSAVGSLPVPEVDAYSVTFPITSVDPRVPRSFQSIKLLNAGGGLLSPSKIEIVGANASDFLLSFLILEGGLGVDPIVTNMANPPVVSPDVTPISSCSERVIRVLFTPSSLGPKSALLRIHFSPPSVSEVLEIALLGGVTEDQPNTMYSSLMQTGVACSSNHPEISGGFFSTPWDLNLRGQGARSMLVMANPEFPIGTPESTSFVTGVWTAENGWGTLLVNPVQSPPVGRRFSIAFYRDRSVLPFDRGAASGGGQDTLYLFRTRYSLKQGRLKVEGLEQGDPIYSYPIMQSELPCDGENPISSRPIDWEPTPEDHSRFRLRTSSGIFYGSSMVEYMSHHGSTILPVGDLNIFTVSAFAPEEASSLERSFDHINSETWANDPSNPKQEELDAGTVSGLWGSAILLRDMQTTSRAISLSTLAWQPMRDQMVNGRAVGAPVYPVEMFFQNNTQPNQYKVVDFISYQVIPVGGGHHTYVVRAKVASPEIGTATLPGFRLHARILKIDDYDTTRALLLGCTMTKDFPFKLARNGPTAAAFFPDPAGKYFYMAFEAPPEWAGHEIALSYDQYGSPNSETSPLLNGMQLLDLQIAKVPDFSSFSVALIDKPNTSVFADFKIHNSPQTVTIERAESLTYEFMVSSNPLGFRPSKILFQLSDSSNFDLLFQQVEYPEPMLQRDSTGKYTLKLPYPSVKPEGGASNADEQLVFWRIIAQDEEGQTFASPADSFFVVPNTGQYQVYYADKLETPTGNGTRPLVAARTEKPLVLGPLSFEPGGMTGSGSVEIKGGRARLNGENRVSLTGLPSSFRVGFDMRVESATPSLKRIGLFVKDPDGGGYAVNSNTMFTGVSGNTLFRRILPNSEAVDVPNIDASIYPIGLWQLEEINWNDWHRIEMINHEEEGRRFVRIYVDGRIYFASDGTALEPHAGAGKTLKISIGGGLPGAVAELDNFLVDNGGLYISGREREADYHHQEFVNETFTNPETVKVDDPNTDTGFGLLPEQYMLGASRRDWSRRSLLATKNGFSFTNGEALAIGTELHTLKVVKPASATDYRIGATFTYNGEPTPQKNSEAIKVRLQESNYDPVQVEWLPQHYSFETPENFETDASGQPTGKSTYSFYRERYYEIYTEDRWQNIRLRKRWQDPNPSPSLGNLWQDRQLFFNVSEGGWREGAAFIHQSNAPTPSGHPVRIEVNVYGRIIEVYKDHRLVAVVKDDFGDSPAITTGSPAVAYYRQVDGCQVSIDNVLMDTDYYFWRKHNDRLIYRGQATLANGMDFIQHDSGYGLGTLRWIARLKGIPAPPFVEGIPHGRFSPTFLGIVPTNESFGSATVYDHLPAEVSTVEFLDFRFYMMNASGARTGRWLQTMGCTIAKSPVFQVSVSKDTKALNNSAPLDTRDLQIKIDQDNTIKKNLAHTYGSNIGGIYSDSALAVDITNNSMLFWRPTLPVGDLIVDNMFFLDSSAGFNGMGAPLPPDGEFATMLWFYPKSNKGNLIRLWNVGSNNSQEGVSLRLEERVVNDVNGLRLILSIFGGPSPEERILGNAIISQNKWHYLALTRGVENPGEPAKYHIYLDQEYRFEVAGSSTTGLTHGEIGGNQYQGFVNNIRHYNGWLPERQVMAIANSVSNEMLLARPAAKMFDLLRSEAKLYGANSEESQYQRQFATAFDNVRKQDVEPSAATGAPLAGVNYKFRRGEYHLRTDLMHALQDGVLFDYHGGDPVLAGFYNQEGGRTPAHPGRLPVEDYALYMDEIVQAARRNDIFVWAPFYNWTIGEMRPWGRMPEPNPDTGLRAPLSAAFPGLWSEPYDAVNVFTERFREYYMKTFAYLVDRYADEPILHVLQTEAEPLNGSKWFNHANGPKLYPYSANRLSADYAAQVATRTTELQLLPKTAAVPGNSEVVLPLHRKVNEGSSEIRSDQVSDNYLAVASYYVDIARAFSDFEPTIKLSPFTGNLEVRNELLPGKTFRPAKQSVNSGIDNYRHGGLFHNPAHGVGVLQMNVIVNVSQGNERVYRLSDFELMSNQHYYNYSDDADRTKLFADAKRDLLLTIWDTSGRIPGVTYYDPSRTNDNRYRFEDMEYNYDIGYDMEFRTKFDSYGLVPQVVTEVNPFKEGYPVQVYYQGGTMKAELFYPNMYQERPAKATYESGKRDIESWGFGSRFYLYNKFFSRVVPSNAGSQLPRPLPELNFMGEPLTLNDLRNPLGQFQTVYSEIIPWYGVEVAATDFDSDGTLRWNSLFLQHGGKWLSRYRKMYEGNIDLTNHRPELIADGQDYSKLRATFALHPSKLDIPDHYRLWGTAFDGLMREVYDYQPKSTAADRGHGTPSRIFSSASGNVPAGYWPGSVYISSSATNAFTGFWETWNPAVEVVDPNAPAEYRKPLYPRKAEDLARRIGWGWQPDLPNGDPNPILPYLDPDAQQDWPVNSAQYYRRDINDLHWAFPILEVPLYRFYREQYQHRWGLTMSPPAGTYFREYPSVARSGEYPD